MHALVAGVADGEQISGAGLSVYDPAWRENLHPAVIKALPPGAQSVAERKRNQPRDRNPAACAEPKAMSDCLKTWEKRTGQRIDPDTSEGRQNLQKALKDINKIEARWDDDNELKPACPNCSQTLPRLWKLAGLDPNDPEYGLEKKMPMGGTSAITPPKKGEGMPFKPDYANKDKYPSDDLGKWHYNAGKWERL